MVNLLPLIPEYCDYYKYLVVEEIALNKFRHLLHYGKCSVIGSTSLANNGLYCLESIKINSMPVEYRLPNGATNIILLDYSSKECLPLYKYCEVFGEVVLYDHFNTEGNILPKTSKELYQEILRSGNIDVTKLHEDAPELIAMMQRYSPALRVHTFNLIDQPSDLIECNLLIRCLSN